MNFLQKKKICYSSQMFENPTTEISAPRNSCAKIACCSPELMFTFVYAASSTQNASELFVSCIRFPYVNFALRPTTQTQI